MTTNIKVTEVFTISDKYIFSVNIEGGIYLIGDVFINTENDLKFELKGIAMENNPNSPLKSISVVPIGEFNSIVDFKGKKFYKQE